MKTTIEKCNTLLEQLASFKKSVFFPTQEMLPIIEEFKEIFNKEDCVPWLVDNYHKSKDVMYDSDLYPSLTFKALFRAIYLPLHSDQLMYSLVGKKDKMYEMIIYECHKCSNENFQKLIDEHLDSAISHNIGLFVDIKHESDHPLRAILTDARLSADKILLYFGIDQPPLGHQTILSQSLSFFIQNPNLSFDQVNSILKNYKHSISNNVIKIILDHKYCETDWLLEYPNNTRIDHKTWTKFSHYAKKQSEINKFRLLQKFSELADYGVKYNSLEVAIDTLEDK